MVLLSNTSNGTLYDITTSIFAILYNKPYELPVERPVIKMPEEILKQYIGEYEIRPELPVVISIKDGNLMAAPTGQPLSILYAEKEDYFL